MMQSNTQICSECQGEAIDQDNEIICLHCGHVMEEINLVKDHPHFEERKHFTLDKDKSKLLFALKMYHADDARKRSAKHYIDMFSRNKDVPEQLKSEMQATAESIAKSSTKLRKDMKGICSGVFYQMLKRHDPSTELEEVSQITDSKMRRILKYSKQAENKSEPSSQATEELKIEQQVITSLESILSSLTVKDLFLNKKGSLPVLARIEGNLRKKNGLYLEDEKAHNLTEAMCLQKVRERVSEQCRGLLGFYSLQMFCFGKKPKNVAIGLLSIVFENFDLSIDKNTLLNCAGVTTSSIYRIIVDLKAVIYAEYQKLQSIKSTKSEASKTSEELSNTECSESAERGAVNIKQLRRAIKFLTKESSRAKQLVAGNL